MIKKWESLGERIVDDLRIFVLKMIKRRHPLSGEVKEYVVLDSPNWVNIIPITSEGKIILVRQYRHGTDTITYEIPGGLVEIDEKPADAALRECKEETGYTSESEPLPIGVNRPNPAYQNNECTTFILRNCRRTHPQNLDSFEDIEVFEFSRAEVKQMIIDGTIDHGVILTAFFFFELQNGFGE